MRTRIRPVKANETSFNVSVLHTALRAVGLSVEEDERAAHTAGPDTRAKVRALRQRLNLPTGDAERLVDDETSAALSATLKDRGLISADHAFEVSGTVRRPDGTPVPRQRLLAFDLGLQGIRRYRDAGTTADMAKGGFTFLGEAISSGQGAYRLTFYDWQTDRESKTRASVVVFAVEGGNGKARILGRSRLVTLEDHGLRGLARGLDVLLTALSDQTQYGALRNAVTPFLKAYKTKLTDLRGSREQLAYLTTELNLDSAQVHALAAAESFAVGRDPVLDVELLYGLRRSGVGLSWSSIRHHTDAELAERLKQAGKNRLIAEPNDSAIATFLGRLRRHATQEQLQQVSADPGRRSLHELLAATLPAAEQRVAFLDAVGTFHGTDFKEFWEHHLPTRPEFQAEPSLVERLQFTEQLAVLTGGHHPLMSELINRGVDSIDRLLALRPADWRELIRSSGIPAGTRDEAAERTYAEGIQGLLDAAFATRRIARMVVDGAIPIDSTGVLRGVADFLDRNRDFDFATSRIDAYDQVISETAGPHAAAVQSELRTLQRVYQVSPTPDAMRLLLEKGFTSARAIAAIPRKSFVRTYGTALGGMDIALATHQRAEHMTARVEMAAMQMMDYSHGDTPWAVMGPAQKQKALAKLKATIPNYTGLFGRPDICECEHCRSVYSAAAYLVDLLRYLAGSKPNDVGRSPLDVLLDRRPDLVHLPLTCENTNTLIPYVDLSTEIMEYYTVHGGLTGFKGHDTGETPAEDLRANQQYFNLEAYRKLKDAAYPFTLPYHQPLDAIRIHADHLGVSRFEVMQAANPAPAGTVAAALAAEALRISQEEYQVLTGVAFDGTASPVALHEYYGLAVAPDLNTLNKVPEFLARTGVSYRELVALIETRFINPHQDAFNFLQRFAVHTSLDAPTFFARLTQVEAGALDPATDANLTGAIHGYNVDHGTSVSATAFAAWVTGNLANVRQVITLYEPQSQCDLQATTLRTIGSIYSGVAGSGLTDARWSVIHRFIRLWRKLGWTIQQTDVVLSALGATDITPDLIAKLAGAVRLLSASRLTPDQLAVAWGSIGTAGKSSLYRKLFLTRAGAADPAFEPDAWGQYLQDPNEVLDNHRSAVLAAFRIREEDLAAILGVARLQDGGALRPIDPVTDPLNLFVLSTLYRYVVLAKALKFRIPDFCTLISLFGASPFSTWDIQLARWAGIDPQQTLDFYRLAESVKASGFKTAELQYILTGTVPPDSRLALDQDGARQAARAIRAAFASIEKTHPDQPPSPLARDVLAGVLALTFQPEIVTRLLAVLDSTEPFQTITDANLGVVIPDALGVKYRYVKGSGRLTCIGVMTDAERTALNGLAGVNANFTAAVTRLYSAPETLLAESFGGIFADQGDARKVLLDHPQQAAPATQEERLRYIYQRFIPILKTRLRRDAIHQHLGSLFGLEEEYVALLTAPDVDALVASLSTEGFSSTYYGDGQWNAVALIGVDPVVDFDWANGAPAPAVPADNFSARWEAYVAAPASGDYTLRVDVAQADESFKLFLDGALLLEKAAGTAMTSLDVVTPLNAARLHLVRLDYAESTQRAAARFRWLTSTVAPEPVPASAAYPARVLDQFVALASLYHRAARLILGFRLSPRELFHLLQWPVDFGNIDFKALTPQHWIELSRYCALRGAIPQAQATLIDVFAAANRANPPASVADLKALLAGSTAWDAAGLDYLVDIHFGLGVPSFRTCGAIEHLHSVMKIAARTGLSAENVVDWGTVTVDFDELFAGAGRLRNAVKAKYEEADWMELAGHLTDALRGNQQRALVAHLLTRPAIKNKGVQTPDGLYEYLLIDVQMEPCMETSRVVQANASIQQFVQRCFLNLESDTSNTSEVGVSPGALDTDRWEWMKNYRVWEANRKVFCYPENWLEPEWRMDRSEFFKELESYLVQSDITPRSVETAFRTYLTRVDEVAHLEVCGIHREAFEDGSLRFLHVVARTPNAPHSYFYRRWNHHRKWSPWERLPVDIRSVDEGEDSGVHIIPVVWKNRLFIFWPEFVVIQEPGGDREQSFEAMGNDMVSANEPRTWWEIHLAWTELQDGKWAPKQVSKEFIKKDSGDVVPSPKYLRFVYSIDASQQLELVYHLWFEHYWYQHGCFRLADITAKVEIGKNEGWAPAWPDYKVAFENFSRTGPLELADDEYLRAHTNHRVLVTPTRSDYAQTLDGPFFFGDENRTYFVRPVDIRKVNRLKHPEWFAPTIPQLVDDSGWKKYKEVPSVGPDDYVPEELTSFAGSRKPSSAEKRSVARAAPMVQNHTAMMMTTRSSAMPMASLSGTVGSMPSAFGGLAGKWIEAWYGYLMQWDRGLEFHTFYHPVSHLYVKRLNQLGMPGLMQSDTAISSDNGTLFESTYNPNFTYGLVQKPADFASATYYKENVCFDVYGANSQYNWELFFHAPLYIATRLSRNGKYAEAMKWFHYIFDPTTDELPIAGEETARYWKVPPFKKPVEGSLTDFFMSLASHTDLEANAIVDEWRDHPFDPHRVAANRPVAYMKHVVIKYVENLIAWGDSLFRQFTRESVYEALQLYVIANHILGPRPEMVPRRGEIRAETFNTLKTEWDKFSNALVALENLFPYSSDSTIASPSPGPSLLGIGPALYFCIPSNDRLMQHWDTVADRLFKIRHCRDIDGIERKLALFAPPIDPGALIQAMSQGLSLGSILADMSSPPPLYRFSLLLQKANELCADVKGLGSALLAAIEKRDSEELGRLRATHETGLLELNTAVRERQLLEARANRQQLDQARATAALRFQHYQDLLGNSAAPPPATPTVPATLTADSSLPGDTTIALVKTDVDESLVDSTESGVKLIPKEQQDLALNEEARVASGIGSNIDAIGGLMNFIPGFSGNIQPFGPGVTISYGGSNIAGGMAGIARFFHASASDASSRGATATKMAGFIRREQDWTLQANLAAREIIQLDKQITAAQIRIQATEKELASHKQQIAHAKVIEQFLLEKFTSQELYQWMREQLFALHKQCYNLAYDMAKKVEKAYRYEIGDALASFIEYGYWDNARQGLVGGERLQLALRQMEASYLSENRRELELTKSVSLARLDPLALVQLRETGKCSFSLPEELYDLDFRGHYFRRLRGMRLSIPCVVGPHTSVACTLRLLSSTVRVTTGLNSQGGYEHENDAGVWIDDERFRSSTAPVTAIATSSAQNDAGMFEFSFRDERYLPFELAGAISDWQLELSTEPEFRNFDYGAISDVILHLNYTARETAGLFRDAAVSYMKGFLKNAADLTSQPMVQLFSMRHDFPTEWHRFLHPAAAGAEQVLKITLGQNRFPYLVSTRLVVPMRMQIFARSTHTGDYVASLTYLQQDDTRVTPPIGATLKPSPKYGGLHLATLNDASLDSNSQLAFSEFDINGEIELRLQRATAADFASLDSKEVEDVFLVLHVKLDDLP